MSRVSLPRAIVLGGALLASAIAGAEPLDPAEPRAIFVGRPDTPAACERLTPERTSLSTAPLPSREVAELSRKSVGSLAHAPVVAPDGSLWVPLAGAELLRLSADGVELGRARLGASPAMRSPVVLSDGGLGVLTSAPSLVFLTPSGKIESTVPLPKASFSAGAGGGVEGFSTLLATEDGAVAVAGGRALLVLESSGRVRHDIDLPERVASDLLPFGRGWLVVGETGKAWAIEPPAAPRALGSLGPVLPGSALLERAPDGGPPRALLALGYPNRVVSLDLKAKAAVARVVDPVFAAFDAPLALALDGTAWLTTSEGFLVGYDAAGAEVSRAAIDRGATPPGGVLGGRGFRPPPPSSFGAHPAPVVDAEGRVAFARSGRFGVRSAEDGGKLLYQTEKSCAGPLAIVPLPKRAAGARLVLACREGTLVFYGEGGEKTP